MYDGIYVVRELICITMKCLKSNEHAVQTAALSAPCGLRGCENRAHSPLPSRPEVVKGVPNQGLDCSISYTTGQFFCFSFVFRVYVVFCFLVFVC